MITVRYQQHTIYESLAVNVMPDYKELWSMRDAVELVDKRLGSRNRKLDISLCKYVEARFRPSSHQRAWSSEMGCRFSILRPARGSKTMRSA